MPTAKGSTRVARQRTELRVEDDRGQFYLRRPTIDVLPDEVLLEIFNFCVVGDYHVDGWHTLIHVCTRWRHIVFTSKHRLNLRLLCTNIRPVKKLLDIWPELPIVIEDRFTAPRHWGVTNIYAALKHNDRVCKISINHPPTRLLKRFGGTKMLFTALTFLCLRSNDETVQVIPDSFLGGSTPRLKLLDLKAIPFPGLPKLLLSAHHLVDLRLWDIPHSGYISPEAMVTALSPLTSLRELVLHFQSPRSRPEQINRRSSALTRTVLPALSSLHFKGVSEYLEVLISRIDAPLLNDIRITFFNQLIFHTPLLRHFISRTEPLKVLRRAAICFYHNKIEVTLRPAHNCVIVLGISCKPVDWQLSSLSQVCNSSLPPLPTLEQFDICEDPFFGPHWDEDVEDTQWLELLYPFITVQNLRLGKNLAPRVAPALRELTGERVTEVLPALKNIFVEELQSSGPVQEAIAQYIAARQLPGHPAAVHDWNGRLWESMD